MTHEFKSLIEQAQNWQKKGQKNVLASVVYLEGSSYRKPGVRMLINDKGEVLGAVSGGCVEKEIHHQAQAVFESGVTKMMTYDGRVRLGCEGVLYILLEHIEMSEDFFHAFYETIQRRQPIQIQSFYDKESGPCPQGGSTVIMNGKTYDLGAQKSSFTAPYLFKDNLPALFRLIIIGGEHDAVQLCAAASHLGWEVHLVVAPDEQKSINYFPGAHSLHMPINHQIDRSLVDKNTAVVLMTHSYSKDVYYLNAVKNTYPCYFGLLGPKKRKSQLIDRLLEIDSEIELAFIEQLRGPAGLNVGAASAQEIAVSILAEILAVTRQHEPIPLKDKTGNIHA